MIGLLGLWSVAAASIAPAQTLRIDTQPPPGLSATDALSVMWGDRLVAGFLPDVSGTPVVYPIVTPGGKQVTRQYPMLSVGPMERDDHPHHRSLWLTHGEVNGIDFWAVKESMSGQPDRRFGSIKQLSYDARIESGDRAVVLTTNQWKGDRGEVPLTDRRRYTVRVDGARLIIDCDFRLTANEGDVTFGDTKEGTFGVRVAGSMKVEQRLGGTFVNSAGLRDGAAWGQPAAWVDYNGPVLTEPGDGQDVEKAWAGITLHCHRSSFQPDTRWHVREYGLFAANPFGVSDFTGQDKSSGHVLKDGQSIDLHYRLVAYDGRRDVEQLQAESEAYQSMKIDPLKP